MNKTLGVIVAAVLAGPLLFVFFIVAVLGGDPAFACTPGSAVVATIEPDTTIAGYDAEQLTNASHIIDAGTDAGMSGRDITIGVMTAMGESSLRVLDYGDDAGPDSRGLFQQRDNGAWGTYDDRMDPYTSASNFFAALALVDDRDELEPTYAASAVQRNADPEHYATWWDPAVEVTAALAGIDASSVDAQGCPLGSVPALDGWASPANPGSSITSSYGMRFHPIRGEWLLHGGTDFATAGQCSEPIYAAAAGVVSFAGIDDTGRGVIQLEHEGGLSTRYHHMYADGIYVRVGDVVAAGQQIAVTGSTGESTACHLHFAILIDGQSTDPIPFLAERGITY